MELYKLLSENYDELFPVPPAQLDFLRRELTGRERLIDIGCGTGGIAALLAPLSDQRQILGIDDSPDMIAAARADHAVPGVDYLQLGMLEMIPRLPPASFDGAVCVGNTLAHLPEPGQVLDLLRQVWTLLGAGGLFVGQIINFDRVIARKIDSLPVIETERVVFRRNYEWEGADMNFRVEVEDKRTGRVERRSTPMRPILKSSLEAALDTAGFGRVDYYGSYSGEPFGEDSYHLIFTAAKA